MKNQNKLWVERLSKRFRHCPRTKLYFRPWVSGNIYILFLPSCPLSTTHCSVKAKYNIISPYLANKQKHIPSVVFRFYSVTTSFFVLSLWIPTGSGKKTHTSFPPELWFLLKDGSSVGRIGVNRGLWRKHIFQVHSCRLSSLPTVSGQMQSSCRRGLWLCVLCN